MERKTVYLADDFISINKYLKELEKKAPIKKCCPICNDVGFRRSVSGRWKECDVCLNHLDRPRPN